MKKSDFKGLLAIAVILSVSFFFSSNLSAQNGTDTKTEKTNPPKTNPTTNVKKAGDVKTNTSQGSATLNTQPVLSAKDQEKLSRAAKQDAEKGNTPQREITVVDYPGYPKYTVTGNAKQDELNYQEAKMKWIRENPEEYKKLLNKNPEVKAEEIKKYRKTPQTK